VLPSGIVITLTTSTPPGPPAAHRIRRFLQLAEADQVEGKIFEPADQAVELGVIAD
jgi:hypothetical protein